eukprot:6309-Heterococcus_DN1.PRE.1
MLCCSPAMNRERQIDAKVGGDEGGKCFLNQRMYRKGPKLLILALAFSRPFEEMLLACVEALLRGSRQISCSHGLGRFNMQGEPVGASQCFLQYCQALLDHNVVTRVLALLYRAGKLPCLAVCDECKAVNQGFKLWHMRSSGFIDCAELSKCMRQVKAYINNECRLVYKETAVNIDLVHFHAAGAPPRDALT